MVFSDSFCVLFAGFFRWFWFNFNFLCLPIQVIYNLIDWSRVWRLLSLRIHLIEWVLVWILWWLSHLPDIVNRNLLAKRIFIFNSLAFLTNVLLLLLPCLFGLPRLILFNDNIKVFLELIIDFLCYFILGVVECFLEGLNCIIGILDHSLYVFIDTL